MAGLTIDNPVTFTNALKSDNIIDGDVLDLAAGTYTGAFSTGTTIHGVEGTPTTIQARDGENVLIDGTITVYGDWVIVKGLHIKNGDFLDRYTDTAGANPPDIPSIEAVKTMASNILIQDCILENSRQGVLKSSIKSNIIIDGCIIFHVGWDGPDRPHGHGSYFTGTTGAVRNSIYFSNCEFGIKIYNEGTTNPPIDNYTVEDNICFNNCVIVGQHGTGTRGDILFGHTDQPFDNPIIRRNYTYQLPEYAEADINGNSNTNHLGYSVHFTNAILQDNYFPSGLKIFEDGVDSTFTTNSGNVYEPEATNKIAVILVRNKLHVAIYNWEELNSVDVDVSSLLDVGDGYSLINVQDYFVDIVTGTTGATQIITVDMRAISHTVAAPQGIDAPATTFPTFGCFVVEKA